MALITRDSTASMDAIQGQKANNLSGLYAGEALDIVAPCHIQSDGLVYMSNATADNADAYVDGWTARAVASGEPVTLFGPGARFRYTAAAGLTPGATLFLGATDGRLDDGATTGDVDGVAFACSDTDIIVTRYKRVTI